MIGIKLKDSWCDYYNCRITFNYLEDASSLFKLRDLSRLGKDADIDFCVYFVYDGKGRIVYIGKGRYWMLTIYGKSIWILSRPFRHKDFLSSQIKSDWAVAIIHCGLTDLEAKLLEAYYLLLQFISGRTLTKRKAEKWDRVSLINKRWEMHNKTNGFTSFYEMAKQYLNDKLWKSLKISC